MRLSATHTVLAVLGNWEAGILRVFDEGLLSRPAEELAALGDVDEVGSDRSRSGQYVSGVQMKK